MSINQYDWFVRKEDWPPLGMLAPPFGPTLIENMRLCGMRARFERSNRYPRKSNPEARIGTAFHQTLESLEKHPPKGSPQQVLEDVNKRFDVQLSIQEEQRKQRVREQRLSFSNERLRKAREALILVGSQMSLHLATPRIAREGPPDTEVEISVRSADGLIEGRIDRVQRTNLGIRIIDYKSGLAGDHPSEGYMRQIRLYAALWNERYGEWPVEGILIFPLSGLQQPVDVMAEECSKVLREAKDTIARNLNSQSPENLARPGEVCSRCEFRPWCQAFWDWCTETATLQSTLGFEGLVDAVEQQNGKMLIYLSLRGQSVLLIADPHQMPHVLDVYPGMRLRVLDTVIQGHGLRKAIIREKSEIFFLKE